MDIWRVLLDVVVLLGAGALLGGLFELRGQSAIIGYLLAGAMLGPNALHLVRGAEEVLAVSELGVALLLFAIGLEFSWSRLRSIGPARSRRRHSASLGDDCPRGGPGFASGIRGIGRVDARCDRRVEQHGECAANLGIAR